MVKRSSSSKSTKSNLSEIKFIRLVTGEDIVSEVSEIANGRMIINNPLKVVYTPSLKTGFLSISLMQWVFTRISTNQTFDLDMHNVLVMTQADDALQKHYNESLFTFSKEKIEEEDDDEDFDFIGPDEGVEMLNNLINKIKGNKGKLH